MATNFIPNSFQHPNIYVDKYMPFLTNNELRVLIYMMRRIFGFHKRQDNISLSQITEGIVTTQGERLDYGAGVCRPAAVKAINGLTQYGLVVEVEDNDPATNNGKCYALELDESRVNFEGLFYRKGMTKKVEAERTKKGRDAIEAKRLVNPINQQESGKSHLPGVVNGIDRAQLIPLTHNRPVETQRETKKEIDSHRGKSNVDFPGGFSSNNPQQPTLLPPSDGSVVSTLNGNGSQHEKAKGKPGRPAKAAHPNTKPILDAYYGALEYSQPFCEADAKAAKLLANAGYTPEQVVAAYRYMKADEWWQDKAHIPLRSVATQIGGILQKLGKGKRLDGTTSQPKKGEIFTDASGRKMRYTDKGLEVHYANVGWCKASPSIAQRYLTGD